MSNKRKIVFVCTGNICRSPIAEYLTRHRLGTDSSWQTCSAGVMAGPGMPASTNGCLAMRDLGIDMSKHRSQPLTSELADAASLIVVMTTSHRGQAQMLFPEAADKLFLMKSFDPAAHDRDIMDPIGMPAHAYRRIRDEIDAAIPGLIEFMNVIENRDD